MKLFLVSPYDEYGERVKQLIHEHFPEHHIDLDERGSPLWVIAAPNDNTPARIAEQLNMAGKIPDDINHGVIMSIGDYYGFDSKALWQQLEAWSYG